MIKSFLLVGLGGSLGAMFRYSISILWRNNQFPYATLMINILGSLLIGIVWAASQKNQAFSDNLKLFLTMGLCGGFTSFSTFSFENVMLLKSGNVVTAGLYIFTSVATCIIATMLGFKLINN